MDDRTETQADVMTNYGISESEQKELDNRFTYHAPKNDQQSRYISLRNKAKELSEDIMRLVPDGREKALALTKLEESIFWANASIARNE